MKNYKQIKEEIKNRVKYFWDNKDKEKTWTSKDVQSFKNCTQYCNALLWVLGDSYHNICPYCGEIIECDLVDIGVGFQQCGPYYCDQCGASEIHPDDKLQLDEDEKYTGFYKNRISPLANTCEGVLVSHTVAKTLYTIGLLDNCKPC